MGRNGPVSLRFLAALALLAPLAATPGCPRPQEKAPKGERVRIRAITDPTPVADIAVLGSTVFVATGAEVDRFDLNNGTRTTLGPEEGLNAKAIHALVADPERAELWIAADRGVTVYRAADNSFRDLPDPPPDLLAGMSKVKMAPAGDGNVFLGGPFGLYRSGKQWMSAGVAEAVTSLAPAADGTLWIGTVSGLKKLDGSGVSSVGVELGVDLARVEDVVVGTGGPVVLGTNADGQQRVAVSVGTGLATYRVSPKMTWAELAGDGRRVAARAEDGELYLLVRSNRLRQLGRDRVELLPAPPKGAPLPGNSPIIVQRVKLRVPGEATALAVDGARLYVGTADLGTGVTTSDKHLRWLRRGELTDGARFLSVACRARDDCFLANGTSRAWRFDGKTFRDPELEDPALAFVRRPDGELLALFRKENGSISLASFDGSTWTKYEGVEITLPEGQVELSFARVSPGGLLWLGIGYVDDQGDVRPKGVALVDPTLGAVTYHHASSDVKAGERGILPIPINTVDASFLGTDEVWLATTQGAVQVKGTELQIYGEVDGLRSEILRGIACSASGMVYIGTRQGVGAYDGETWAEPAGLSMPVNDIRIAKDGRLWIGTDRGLTSFDGAKIRRLDARRGLLEDRVLELDIDNYGRLWLRGPESITVVVP